MGEDRVFRFKRFQVSNERSALKVGTDAVLLGAAMTLSPNDRNLLDIGTGTGVIALMASQRLEGAACRITAIDIDGPSADEAGFNFRQSPWPEVLSSRHLPLSEYKPEEALDCIFSNPPFYDDSLKNPDRRESAARHTESLSYREICAFSADNLTPDGRLSLILPAEEEKALLRTAASFGLFPFRILRIRTTPSKPFRRIVAEFSRKKGEASEEELTLGGSARTDEYAALTADFYL